MNADPGRWWHAWGGVIAEGANWEGCWVMVVLGPSFVPPEDAGITTPPDDVTRLGLAYMHTWNHEPSEAEKKAVTPPEYLDDDELNDGEGKVMEAPPSPGRLLAALRGSKCGKVWFAPTIPKTEECWGWHWCRFGPEHDGPHVCRGCKSQPAQDDGDA